MSQPLSRFLPAFTEDSLPNIQWEGIRWTLSHAYANSPQYREKFKAAGVHPYDVQSLKDFRKVPFTSADDLRAGYPLPLLAVPERDIVRVHASSGTTGKRKVLAYTQDDVNTFNLQMARCYELAGLTPLDRMQIAVGYGLWTAGAGFQLGSELFGALTVPVGAGNLEIHMQLMQDLQVTCFGSTASMALLLAEEVERNNLQDKLALRKIIFGSELHNAKMRRTFEQKLGLEGSYDIAGMTEMYGPGTGIECDEQDGIHYWADLFYIEIINPETLEPVEEGEVGEMVVTTLCKEASPLVRYRTRDLTRLIPGTCACGRTIPRHDHLLGRSDDMIIYRGVNIYPGQIADILQEFQSLGGEYHIELTRRSSKDFMHLKVEHLANDMPTDTQNLATAIETALHKAILARISVEIVPCGALPRSFSKSKRVTDMRLS